MGVGVVEGVRVYQSAAEATAYKTGYDRGRSDTVKHLYWAQQNLHDPLRAQAEDQVALYPIPIPEQEIDGVVQQPTTRILRIQR